MEVYPSAEQTRHSRSQAIVTLQVLLACCGKEHGLSEEEDLAIQGALEKLGALNRKVAEAASVKESD